MWTNTMSKTSVTTSSMPASVHSFIFSTFAAATFLFIHRAIFTCHWGWAITFFILPALQKSECLSVCTLHQRPIIGHTKNCYGGFQKSYNLLSGVLIFNTQSIQKPVINPGHLQKRYIGFIFPLTTFLGSENTTDCPTYTVQHCWLLYYVY